MLLPALSSAKEKARDVLCQSNQRQLSLGYRQALDEEAGDNLGKGSAADWFTVSQLGVDMRKDGLAASQARGWICPTAPVTPATNGPEATASFGTANTAWWAYGFYEQFGVGDTPQFRASSYVVNSFVFEGPPADPFVLDFEGWSTNYFLTESAIKSPSLTAIFADGIWSEFLPGIDDGPPYDLNRQGTDDKRMVGMWAALIARHGSHPIPAPHSWPANKRLPGSVNVSFFDGHVEPVNLYNLWQLKWHKNWVPGRQPGLN